MCISINALSTNKGYHTVTSLIVFLEILKYQLLHAVMPFLSNHAKPGLRVCPPSNYAKHPSRRNRRRYQAFFKDVFLFQLCCLASELETSSMLTSPPYTVMSKLHAESVLRFGLWPKDILNCQLHFLGLCWCQSGPLAWPSSRVSPQVSAS